MPASFAGAGISARDHSARTREEAGDVLGDLPGVLAAEITPEARLPDLRVRDPVDSDCRLLRAMVSPKTSRSASRRSVLLASGLGIPPMTLDLDVICILGVPIAGIAAIGAASARQFVLGDRELVALARLDHEFAPVALSRWRWKSRTGNAMLQPVEDDLFETVERLADLRSARAAGVSVCRFVHALCSSAFMSLMVEANASGGTAAPSP